MPELRRLTDAEIAAANLRRMARDLLLEAERLEASVPGRVVRAAASGNGSAYDCPLTGKKIKVKSGRLLD